MLLSSGGPLHQDNVSTEEYATVFARAESPIDAQVLWAGSDDGLLHVTCDSGSTRSKLWRIASPGDKALAEIDAELIDRSGGLSYASPSRLNAKLAALSASISAADSTPTQTRSGRVRRALGALRRASR